MKSIHEIANLLTTLSTEGCASLRVIKSLPPAPSFELLDSGDFELLDSGDFELLDSGDFELLDN